jgi:hypothetical protein
MMTIAATQIYRQHIQNISVQEQLQIVALITQHLMANESLRKPKLRSLLELEGLGAELWQARDAQEYVEQLRREWE